MTRQRSESYVARSVSQSTAGLPVLAALAALAVLALTLLLAGCGQTGASDQGSTAGAAHTLPVSTPTRTVAATGTRASPPTAPVQKGAASAGNGCLVAQAPANAASFTPDVILSQPAQAASAPQPVTLARGQRLEIRLSPTYTWEVSAADPSGILAAVGPQGWYDSSAQACIWRFAAQTAGNAQLTFVGAVVCPPLELCPSVEQAITYAVTVH